MRRSRGMTICYEKVLLGTQLLREFQGKVFHFQSGWSILHLVGGPQGNQRNEGN
jgi:hypothetical protein